MIKRLLLNWKTSASGVGLLVASIVPLVASIINHTSTQLLWSTSIMGIFGGLAALAAGDAAASAKQHAESQAQIAELQLRSNIVPNAIDSGDTSQLRRVPMTPAAIPPPVVPGITAPPTVDRTPPKP